MFAQNLRTNLEHFQLWQMNKVSNFQFSNKNLQLMYKIQMYNIAASSLQLAKLLFASCLFTYTSGF